MSTVSTRAPPSSSNSHFTVSPSAFVDSATGVRAGGASSSSRARSALGQRGQLGRLGQLAVEPVPRLVDAVAGLAGQQLGERVAVEVVAGGHAGQGYGRGGTMDTVPGRDPPRAVGPPRAPPPGHPGWVGPRRGVRGERRARVQHGADPRRGGRRSGPGGRAARRAWPGSCRGPSRWRRASTTRCGSRPSCCERELAIEAHELRRRPEHETAELAGIYEDRGCPPRGAAHRRGDDARPRGRARDPRPRGARHRPRPARFAPGAAAASSFVAFSIGAVVPLAPWFFGSGAAAKVTSLLLGVVAAVIVGVLVARSTRRPAVRTVGRQVAFTVIPAAITFAIGSALGVGTA